MFNVQGLICKFGRWANLQHPPELPHYKRAGPIGQAAKPIKLANRYRNFAPFSQIVPAAKNKLRQNLKLCAAHYAKYCLRVAGFKLLLRFAAKPFSCFLASLQSLWQNIRLAGWSLFFQYSFDQAPHSQHCLVEFSSQVFLRPCQ